MTFPKDLLTFVFCLILCEISKSVSQTNAAVIKNLPTNENHPDITTTNKRDAEKTRIKTYRIIAEHIGPREHTLNGEQDPKYDSVEFEEKNVDTVEQVFTTVEEVTTLVSTAGQYITPLAENYIAPLAENYIAPSADKYKRSMTEPLDTVSYAGQYKIPLAENYIAPLAENYIAPLAENHIAPLAENYIAPLSENYIAPSADKSKRSMTEKLDTDYHGDGNDYYENDPAFRNRRSQYARSPLKSDFDEISDIYPKFGSVLEKDLHKRFFYEMVNSLNNSSPNLTSSNKEAKFNNNENNISEKRNASNSTRLNVSDAAQFQSPTASKSSVGSTTISYNNNLSRSITPQPKSGNSLELKSETKRNFGSLGNKTKFVDLNDPKLNFSYVAKPGDDIVLRKDRQGLKSSNQSERTKKDNGLKEVGKKVEIIEETIDSGDTGLNISNVNPLNEDEVLKLAAPLMKLDKDSGGHMKWNVREDVGDSKVLEIGNRRAPYDVIYVGKPRNQEAECDSLLLELFRSNLFVASVIFVLIVTVILLTLMLIYLVAMRSVDKNKHMYRKLSSEEYACPKHTKGSKTLWNNVAPYIKGLLCRPVQSSDDARRNRVNNCKDGDIENGTKLTRSLGQTIRGSSSGAQKKGSKEFDERKYQMKQERKPKSDSHMTSYDKPEEDKYRKEVTQSQPNRQVSFQDPKEQHIYNKTRKELGNIERSRAIVQNSEGKRSTTNETTKKQQYSKGNIIGKRYSVHRHVSNDGPIISYTRMYKAPENKDDKANKSSSRNTDNTKPGVIDWMQRKFSAISSGISSSSDIETQDEDKHSNKKSQDGMGTRIKGLIFGPDAQERQRINQSSDESDSDSSVGQKKRKLKSLKNKRNILKMSQNPKDDLASMMSETDFSSGASPPPKNKELVQKFVTTGDNKKIDDMLSGQRWRKSIYYGQGIRTLDDKPTYSVGDKQEQDGGPLKNSSSSMALQAEVGRSINVAEDNIKLPELPQARDKQNI